MYNVPLSWVLDSDLTSAIADTAVQVYQFDPTGIRMHLWQIYGKVYGFLAFKGALRSTPFSAAVPQAETEGRLPLPACDGTASESDGVWMRVDSLQQCDESRFICPWRL